MSRRTENELLAEAARGDAASFGEVVRKYGYLAYAAALQIVKDPAAARVVCRTRRRSSAFPPGPWRR